MISYTAHEDYMVVTDPAEHGLCGEVVSLGYYDDSLANGDPLTYDATNQQFTADSDDTTLNGLTKDYSVRSELADYPNSSFSEAPTLVETSTIIFKNPCLTPTSFEATEQTSPVNWDYAGALEFTVNPFTYEPSDAVCVPSYEC